MVMSIRIFIFLFFSILCGSKVVGQVFNDNSVTAPPETGNEFMKSIHNSVNHQSGALNFSLNLMSLKVDDNFEIPITLSYTGSGIRYDQKNGEVAVGWGISTNYKINRTIYGRPDEHYPKSSDQNLYDLAGENLDNVGRDIELTQFTSGLPSNGGLMLKSGLQELDGEYDIFDYNFPGTSGSFVIKDANNQEVVFPGHPLYKIGMNIDENLGIEKIEIRDEKGIRYRAGYDSINNIYLSESLPRYGRQAAYSWPITNICTLNNKEVRFNYKLSDVFEPSKNPLAFSIVETNGPSRTIETSQTVISDATDNGANLLGSYLTESIISVYGSIYIFRQFNSTLIDSILLKDNYENQVKKVVFNRSAKGGYLFLDSLAIYGSANGVKQIYKFNYYNKDSQGIYDADIWGYLKLGNSSVKKFPLDLKNETYFRLNEISGSLETRDITYTPGIAYVDYENRNPTVAPIYYSLKNVVLPTGGIVSYTYEPNLFENNSNVISVGPGLRIKAIEEKDVIANGVNVKKFKYGNNGNGLGNIMTSIDKYFFGLDQILISLDASSLRILSGSRMRLFSNDIIADSDPFYTRYNHVSYSVIEESDSMGSIRYFYKEGKPLGWGSNSNQNQIFYNEHLGIDIETNFRPGFVNNYNIGYAPLLEKMEIIDKNGNVVKKNLFQYENRGNESLLQIKIKPYAIFSEGLFSAEYNHAYSGFESIYDYCLSTIDLGTFLISHKETIERNGSDSVITKTDYNYNSFNQLISETIDRSDGSEIITQYTYPNQLSNINSIDDLSMSIKFQTESNLLSEWLEKRVYVVNSNYESPILINSILRQYFVNSNNVRRLYTYNNELDQIFTPIYVEAGNLMIDEKYSKEINEIVKLNNNGDVLSFIDKTGIENSIFYGYKNLYPVLTLKGIGYEQAKEVVDSSILSSGSENQIQSHIVSIRNSFVGNSKVNVNSFFYRPLIGIKSHTDVNARTLYYEYDDLNRLSVVRNHEGKIVKILCYKSIGQQEYCKGQKIYVKITRENIEYTGDLIFAEALVKFYIDEDCTIPIKVENFAINCIEKTVYSNGSIDEIEIAYSCSGFEMSLEGSIQIGDSDINSGFERSYILTEGIGYIPINNWQPL